MAADENGPSLGEVRGMPACDEGGSSPGKGATVDRNGPSLGRRREMPASTEGASPARWRQRAGGGHRWEREERCRLAKREQPQWVRDHGQELATSGRGKTRG